MAVLLVMTARPAAAERQLLTASEVLVLGVSLHVEPATQVVPPGVPTVVKTSLVAAGQPGLKVPLGDLPPGMRVKADLHGPGLTPVALECAPGGNLSVPALAQEGTYRLENIRLMSDGDLLMVAETPVAELKVQNLLITRVESRPLTLAEIEERGIVIDPSDFQVLDFTLAMALESGAVEVDVPVVIPSHGECLPLPAPELAPLDIGPAAERPVTVDRPEVEAVGFVPVPADFEGDPRGLGVTGMLVFPQAIGYLNQFHSVLLLVTNGAPPSTPLGIQDLKATFTLPSGNRLKRVKTVPLTGASDPVPVRHPGPDGKLGTGDDLNLIAAQMTGSSELVTEGLQEGLHPVTVALDGTVTGLPGGDDVIHGGAAGVVLVKNPSFSLTFLVPSVIEEGREFELATVVTNTGSTPANLVSVRLPNGAVSGATLVTAVTPEVAVIPTIAPGESGTARFRLKALRTGRIAATRFYHPADDLKGKFELQLAVGDDAIPLSPEVMVLPDVAYRLPGPLVDGLLAFAGTAWASATAPAGSLPPGVPQVDARAVKRFAAQIADGGQRLELGESAVSVLGHLLIRMAGGEHGDAALDGLRRLSKRWPEASAALAAALDAEVGPAGPAGALAETIAQEHYYLSPFLLAGLDVTGPDGAVELRVEDEYHRRLGGAEGARDLPWGELLALTGTRRLAVVGQAPGAFTVALEASHDATVELTLAIARETAPGVLAPARVKFTGVSIAEGVEGSVTFEPSTTTYHLQVGSQGYDATATPIDAPALDVVSAKVATAMDAGNHVLALRFNRPVDGASARATTSYSFEGPAMLGQQLRAASVQVSGRFVFLRLLNPVPPAPVSRVRVSGVKDSEGTLISPARTLDIAVPPSTAWGTIHATVLDGKGLPVPGILVALHESLATTYGGGYVGQQTAMVPVDGSGELQFWYVRRTGRVAELTAVHPKTGEVGHAYGKVQVDGEDMRLVLRFLGRGDVTGRVVDSASQPVERALVTGRGTTQAVFSQAFTGGDGRFRVSDLAVGAVNLSASTKAGQYAAATAVIPEAGSVIDVGDLAVDTVDVGIVSGRVTHGGQPAQAVPVVVSSSRTSPRWGTWMRTDADGAYRFTGVPAAKGSGSTIEVAALDPADSRIVLAGAAGTLVANGDLTLDLFYTVGKGRVTGVVLDAYGHPVGSGVAVQTGQKVGGTTDAQGHFVFDGIPLGKGSVYLGDPSSPDDVAGFQLGYDGQETSVILRQPARGTLTVQVTKAGAGVGGASVSLRGAGKTCTTPALGGSCTVNDVKTGRYTVDVYKETPGTPPGKEAGIGSATVRYAGDAATVTVALPRTFSITGTTYEGTPGTVLGGSKVKLYAPGLDSEGHLDWMWYPTPVTSHPTTGEFSFPAVLEGSYSLRATNPTLATEAAKAGVLGGAATVDLHFPTSPLVTLKVEVTMPDGSAPAADGDVHVVLRKVADGAQPEQQQDGVLTEFHLDPGQYFTDVTYHPTGGPEYRASTRLSTGNDDDPPLVVRLNGFGTVKGRVRDAQGALVTGTTVSVTLRAAALPREPEQVTVSTTSGEFTFSNVREGFVSLFAEVAGGAAGNASGSLAAGAVLDREVLFAPSGKVTGHVLRPDGSGAEDVTVYLKRDLASGGSVVLDAVTTSDAQGSFALGPVEYEAVSGSAYRLFALDLFTGRYASQGVWLAGAEATATLKLGKRGEAEGFVLDSDGVVPIARAVVDLQQGGGAPEMPGLALKTSADPGGFYQFLGVSEGSFAVSSRKPDTALFARGEGSLTSEGQVQRLDLTLEAHGVVAGVVQRDGAGVNGVDVKLSAAGSSPVSVQTHAEAGSDGNFSFDYVKLGAFRIEAKSASLGDVGGFEGVLAGNGDVAWCDVVLNGFGTVPVDVTGQPPGIQYFFTLVDGAGNSQSQTGTSTTFHNVQRGDLHVSAAQVGSPGNAGSKQVAFPQGVSILPTVHIALGSVARVSGTLSEPDGTTPVKDTVAFLTSGGESYLAKVDGSGAFDFGWVRATGSLVLEARLAGAAGGWARIRDTWGASPGDRTFDLRLDYTPAKLVSSAPADGATGVSGLSQVVLTFTEAMDPVVAAAKATLAFEGQAVAGVTVDTSGNDVRLQVPAGALQSARTYTALLPASAEDAHGVPIGKDVAVRFTARDQDPPHATLTNPGSGADNVPLATAVTVTFDEPMDEDTVPGGVTLTCGGSPVGATLDASRLHARFAMPLPGDRTCTVAVTATAKDLAVPPNAAVAASWSFTTEDTIAPAIDHLAVLSPTGGGPYPEGSLITIEAVPEAASTPSIDVKRVDFFVLGALVASDTTGPAWQAPVEVPAMTEAGGSSFAVSARAMDGGANLSAPTALTLDISADQPPAVSIVLPQDGLPYDVGSPIPVKVHAADDSGVAEIAWWVDGLADAGGAESYPSSPLTHDLETSFLPPDEYQTGDIWVQAAATDQGGNTVSAIAHRITLMETGIAGRVKLPSGALAGGVKVTMTGTPGSFTGFTASGVPDPAELGKYKVGGKAGDYQVLYQEEVSGEATGRRAQSSVSLVAGVQDQPDTILGGRGTVSGTVRLQGVPFAGATVRVLHPPYGETTTTSAADGTYSVTTVPAVPGLSAVARSAPDGFDSPAASLSGPADGFLATGVDLDLRTPLITVRSPSSGPVEAPSHTVEITGDWFEEDGLVVRSDGAPVPFTWHSRTSLTITLPRRGAGEVAIEVENPDGGRATTTFRYDPNDKGRFFEGDVADIGLRDGYLYAAVLGPGARRLVVFHKVSGTWTEVGHLDSPDGGAYHVLAATGDHVFVHRDQRQVDVVDVTNPASPALLQTVELDMDIAGYPISHGPGEAWFASGNRVERLAVLPGGSVSRLAPIYLGMGINRIRLVGDRLYVTSPATYGASPGGVRVFDVSDPERPSLLGERTGQYHGLAVAGNRMLAWLNNWPSSRLELIDVTDPGSFVSLAVPTFTPQASEITLSGGRAYIASAGDRWVRVVDMSDGQVLEDEAVDIKFGAASSALIDGTSLLVAGQGAGIHEFVVNAEPRSPVPVALTRWASPSSPALAIDFSIAGYDFVSGATVHIGTDPATVKWVGQDEIRVTAPSHAASGGLTVEVTNPDGRTGTCPTPFQYTSDPHLFGVATGHATALGGDLVRLDGINLAGASVTVGTDPTPIPVVGGAFAAPPGGPWQRRDVHLGSDLLAKALLSAPYLWDLEREGPLTAHHDSSATRAETRPDGSTDVLFRVTAGVSELEPALDYARIESDGRVSRHGRYQDANIGHTLDFRIQGGLAFIAIHHPGNFHGIRVVDLFHLPAPVVVKEITSPGVAGSHIPIAGDLLLSSDQGCLFDIHDLGAVTNLGCLGATLSGDVQFDGRYAYELRYSDATGSDVNVYDYRNPARPARVGGVHLGELVWMTVDGNRAFLGAHDGVYSLDLSDPEAPVLHGRFDFPAGVSVGAFQAQVFNPVAIGDRLYMPIDHPHGGFQVFDASDPWSLVPTVQIGMRSSALDRAPHAPAGIGSRILTSWGNSKSWVIETDARDQSPALTSLAPASGPTAGGAVVTVTGRRFHPRAEVWFGGVEATQVDYVSQSRLLATAPAGTGTAELKVVNPDGRQSTPLTYSFSDGSPVLSQVRPTSGPISGGTTVTIRGWGFTGIQKVVFHQGTSLAEVPSSSMSSPTPTTLTFALPAAPSQAAGPADIEVVTALGSASLDKAFDYVPARIGSHDYGWGSIWVCGDQLYHSVAKNGSPYLYSFDLSGGEPFPVRHDWAPDGWVQACVTDHITSAHTVYDSDGGVTTTISDTIRSTAGFRDRMVAEHNGSHSDLAYYDVASLGGISKLDAYSGFDCELSPQAPLYQVRDTVVATCLPENKAQVLDAAGDALAKTWSVGRAIAGIDGRVAFLWEPDGLALYDLSDLSAPQKQGSSFPVRKGMLAITATQVMSGEGGMVEIWDRNGPFTLTLRERFFPAKPFDELRVWDNYLVLNNGPQFFKLTSAPDTLAVHRLYPAQGPRSGGEEVLIDGVGMDRVTQVAFNGAVTAFTKLSPTRVAATAPAFTGSTPQAVTVTVTGAGSPAETATADYTYEAGQRTRWMDPKQGPNSGATFRIGLEVDTTSLTATICGGTAGITVTHERAKRVRIDYTAVTCTGKNQIVVKADGEVVTGPGEYELMP